MEIKVEIEGKSPIIMNKPLSKDEAKRVDVLPDKEQAEYRCYRMNGSKSNLAISGAWIKGSIREHYTETAPNKKKGEYKKEISPSISLPLLIDLGITEYDVRKVPIQIKVNGKVVNIVEPAQPIINTPWSASFVLMCTLNKSVEEIKRIVEGAGKYVGIGSNNINGYGRFEVTNFTKISE